MKSRFILFLFGLVVPLSELSAQDAPKPNILWLVAEDFGQHLGCYGTKEVFTPSLDRLASKGVRYNRFFTTAPVCSASRSALMTGMYQTTLGAHQHRTAAKNKKALPEGVMLLTDRLRGAGYFTANLRQLPESIGFKGGGKTDFNFKYAGAPFDSDQWNELKGHQPFYAQINFQQTHRKFSGPSKADPAKVEIPPYYPDHPVVREDWARYLDAASDLDGKIGRILEQLEKDGLSENTIVVFLGDNGQAHVRGKQFCYDSGLLVPLIIYYPEKLRAPQVPQPGMVSSRLLEGIDLTAQTLDWAGVAKPASMQGRVFIGERADPPREIAFGARDRCDETVMRLRTGRDERYRYIRNFTPDRPLMLRNDYKAKQYPAWNLIQWLGEQGKLENDAQRFLVAPTMPKEELYDTVEDPHETVNLATSDRPDHQAALKRLRAAGREIGPQYR